MPASDTVSSAASSAGPAPVAASARAAILWGTLIAGTMDISAAIGTWWFKDVAPSRVLQSVAGGLLGREATFSGGGRTAALGLFLHFAIMGVIVTLFYLSSRRLPFMTGRRWWLVGIAYAVAVYVVMTFVVVPLSALAPVRPQPMSANVQGLLVHITCVGLPIALITRHFARKALSPGD
jgi:hypothetical protein